MGKNIIKVMIFSGYGIDCVTRKMQNIMDKYDFPKNRVGEICDYVESKATFVDSSKVSWEEICEFLEKNPDEIIFLDNRYYIYEPSMGMPCKIAIKEVDINRPWTIMDYDGAEYIKYLDFDVIDDEIHYCKYRKEEK